jgi:hypothetical protein
MKSSLIGLVFFGTVLVAGTVAAQSPVATQGNGQGNGQGKGTESPFATQGEGTDIPDRIGPEVVQASPAALVAGAVTQPLVAVTTYHYDNHRTGWNNQETTLSATSFPSTFGILGQPVHLDDQVDAQPLVVPQLTIAGGTHDVVYVATENNTIYAIDASNGMILLVRNLGSPVPSSTGESHTGIMGTPVIDVAAQTLYVIADVNVNGTPTHQLYALNLTDLTTKVGPVTVAASHKLSNGTTYTFNAKYQRQRPALLLDGNIVYAGFGSLGDFNADVTRGWLLGWTASASTLTPLPGNELTDTRATSPTSFFLSSIWMSGYGIAASGTRLYFSTGNSDCNWYANPEQCPATTTYDGVTNIQESVVRVDPNLTLLGVFTPSNVASLDRGDADVGSGGVMLLPTEPGSVPYLAVIGAKDGRLFLLDRNNLGGLQTGGLDTQQLEQCWCGPSFFTGSDGVDRIVTSHGSTLRTWRLHLTPSPHLTAVGAAAIASGQDPGFLTSVSSNGTTAGAIIWAVGRPTDPTTTYVNLYAFEALSHNGTYKLLFSSPAGSWPNTSKNANIVPVVANGKVYVAANQSLTIFGTPPGLAPIVQLPPSPIGPIASPSNPHVISGTLLAANGTTLTLQTRTGKSVEIDDSQAAQNEQIGAPLTEGIPLTAQGSSFNRSGALQATSIVRAKGSSGELWPPDQ